MARKPHPLRDVLEFPDTVVKEQAEIEVLWAVAQTPMEDMLQKALRRLHRAVEGMHSDPTRLATLFRHVDNEHLGELQAMLQNTARYEVGPQDREDLVEVVHELVLRRQQAGIPKGTKTKP